MKLSVISLFRDSEPYIHDTFRNLEALERRHDVEYFFYENDSEDRTVALLRAWMERRPGILVTERLGAKRFGHDTDHERMIAMAGYRNRILAEARRASSAWTLLLDSDVEFPGDLIEQYLAHDDPAVAMFTPFIECNIACHMCRPRCGRAAYYDTLALRDRHDRRGPGCSCNPFWDEEDRRAWAAGLPVEVHCAFGGAALIRSAVLRKCRYWSDGDIEHVGFARDVRAHGRILAVPTVKAWTRAAITVPNPSILRMQEDLLRNPLLLRFWTARNWGESRGQR